ncbi:ChaN family lipoprotein [Palleronia sp. LCG004]|uniref:ChaN family lipoprotein n=1 Tax=Palleronia sp. LCG004 TaxID=3079304 RepID=UPI00294308E4|nr:ChaN family lipoprotein [Palleronia sp. LCG004]WOI55639.1 ChaN family lipoprotein [Palleronia sp. LCG004]
MRCFIRLSIAVLTLGTAIAHAQDVPLKADIVVMGELHDIAEHHANQAGWIDRMGPSAIVFEMLEPEQGEIATDMQGDPAEILGTALAWEERGWPDFNIYAPIFARANGARIYGASVARDRAALAVEDGAAAVIGPGASESFALDIPIPLEERAIREAEQAEAHCGLMPPEMLAGMVEAQRLRDATLAQIAIRAFDETGGSVAIVTGNGHARNDWGVPVYLKAARPDLSVTSIGQYVDAESDAPFDHVVIAGGYPDDRDDPCDALR